MRALLPTAAIAAVLMLTACERNEGPAEDTYEPIDEPAGTMEPAPGRYEEPAQPPAQQPPAEPRQPPQQ